MSIYLDIKACEKLNAIAFRQHRTRHALANEAIHQLIQQQERELTKNLCFWCSSYCWYAVFNSLNAHNMSKQRVNPEFIFVD